MFLKLIDEDGKFIVFNSDYIVRIEHAPLTVLAHVPGQTIERHVGKRLEYVTTEDLEEIR